MFTEAAHTNRARTTYPPERWSSNIRLVVTSRVVRGELLERARRRVDVGRVMSHTRRRQLHRLI